MRKTASSLLLRRPDFRECFQEGQAPLRPAPSHWQIRRASGIPSGDPYQRPGHHHLCGVRRRARHDPQAGSIPLGCGSASGSRLERQPARPRRSRRRHGPSLGGSGGNGSASGRGSRGVTDAKGDGQLHLSRERHRSDDTPAGKVA